MLNKHSLYNQVHQVTVNNSIIREKENLACPSLFQGESDSKIVRVAVSGGPIGQSLFKVPVVWHFASMFIMAFVYSNSGSTAWKQETFVNFKYGSILSILRIHIISQLKV